MEEAKRMSFIFSSNSEYKFVCNAKIDSIFENIFCVISGGVTDSFQFPKNNKNFNNESPCDLEDK